jgi:hypothetical protein
MSAFCQAKFHAPAWGAHGFAMPNDSQTSCGSGFLLGHKFGWAVGLRHIPPLYMYYPGINWIHMPKSVWQASAIAEFGH